MENNKSIKVLTLRFDGEISQEEVPYFRGAVLAHIGKDSSILFHNHADEEKYRYSYPMIQYKRIGRKAAIVCVEEGCDVIGQLMMHSADNAYQLGNRKVKMSLESVVPTQILLQIWQDTFRYYLNKWIPLNGENYKKYVETDSATERISLLENILQGNLLSMCKGLGILLDKHLEVTIVNVSEPRLIRNKGIKLMSFDVEFKTNLSIPDYVGIGKNVSLGYGIIRKKQ